VLEATRHLLMIDGWLCYRMSGVAATEPSSASASLLFDIQQRQWSPAICQIVGVREDMLPAVGESGQVIGTLQEAAAEELGLLPGTPVVLGGGDGQCGLLGLGIVDLGNVGAISGTTTPMLRTVARPCLDPQERTWTECHAVPGLWAVEANAGSTGLSYRWLRDLLWTLPGTQQLSADAYDCMDNAAATVPAGSAGLHVYLGAHTMDLWRRDIIGRTAAFLGMHMDGSIAGTRAAITRAMLESIAFAARYNWDLLHEVAGPPASALHVGGGQVRSRLWCEIVADVLGIRLLVGAPEAAALGAAMCAWVGAGRASDLASVSRDLAAQHAIVLPRAEQHERYDAIYQSWLDGRGTRI
jgi:autoinducer 2 (AI-2) kinase